MDHLCYLCLVFVILSRLFIAALWSPAGKGLTSWLLFAIRFYENDLFLLKISKYFQFVYLVLLFHVINIETIYNTCAKSPHSKRK